MIAVLIAIALVVMLLHLVSPRRRSYSELLQTKEWRNKRLTILDRDTYRCQWCGSTHDLQVHHKYYNKYPDGTQVPPWDYPDDALITLCGECHRKGA